MSRAAQLRFWLAGVIIAGIILYLLSGVLLPFVAGIAVAFLFDPLADRLEALGLSRIMATVMITAFFFLTLILALVLLAPLIAAQFSALAANLPDYMKRGQALMESIGGGRLREILALGGGTPDISGMMGGMVNWAGGVLGQALSSGLALFNILALLFLTPVVSFYLLLDWDRLVARIDELLPRDHAPVIRRLSREINDALAGFARGQISVCLILAAFYGIALSLAGLKFGLVTGTIAGLLSFIPFAGALIGLIASLLLAVIQFWPDYLAIAVIAAIFFAGQALEGNFLTPRLVGRRVGLHPLWVIFALLAFGSLLGFAGMLLAVPLAAVIGVLARHFTQGYLNGPLYSGEAAEDQNDPAIRS